MDLQEFEQAVIAGEINDFNTDLKYYFEEAEDDDIRTMQRICIENNVYKKAYRDWAEEFVFTDDYDMQYLPLDAKECLDILICSENKEVRREVVEKDIEYAFEDHVMEYDQDIIMENLMNAIEPHAELLDTFLECHDGSWDLRALELKQKARNIVPTTIEKTMSPYQLYASNSPLWTIELSANEIESFLDIEKNTGRLSEELFTQTYAYETNQTYIIDTETFDSPYLTPNLKKGI